MSLSAGADESKQRDLLEAPAESAKVRTDNPIESAKEDRLQRTDIARAFARQVLDLDASRGLTVGVFGAWGSGKTSFMNLVRAEFEREGVPTLDFNPWMFSDTEQLVVRFFGELSASLGQQGLEGVGQAIAKYGGAIVGTANLASTVFAGFPGLGDFLGTLIKSLQETTDQQGVWELRKEVETALSGRESPIVVVLDDVDRLTFEEIRQVFKLVRLTASFPNLIYVVLCDRHRVEQALQEQGEGDGYGRDYLEKIVQYPFDLPEVPRHLLTREFEAALTEAMAGVEPGGFRTLDLVREVYADIIEPLIRNMRDVRRYATAVRGAATDLAGEIEMADLLGLEAVRLFLPAVFKRLHGAIDAITYPTDSRADERGLRELKHGLTKADPGLKQQVEQLVTAGTQRPGVVEAMLKTLFPFGHWYLNAGDEETLHRPTGDTAKTDRRMADEAILRLYLERVEGIDIRALRYAESALRLLDDGAEFEAFLQSIDQEEIVEVLRDFCRLSARFKPSHAEQGVSVLLNLLPEMPRETYLRRPLMVLRGAVFALLKAVGDPEIVAAVTERILPRVKSLAAKAELLLLIGHSKYVEERLVTETVSGKLDAALVKEIRKAFKQDEIDESETYASTLSFPARFGQRLDLPDSPELAFRLAHSAHRVGWSGTTESRSLDWGFLALLYGDHETAVARARTICDDFDEQKWSSRLKQWGISVQEAAATIEITRESLPPVDGAASSDND